RHAVDGDLRAEHDRRRRLRRLRRRDQHGALPRHRRVPPQLTDVPTRAHAVSTASETAGRVVPPVSRSRVFWRSPLGKSFKRVPFYLLVVIVFVYALFPFASALRCAFTPEGDLFSSPLQYIPHNPT